MADDYIYVYSKLSRQQTNRLRETVKASLYMYSIML